MGVIMGLFITSRKFVGVVNTLCQFAHELRYDTICPLILTDIFNITSNTFIKFVGGVTGTYYGIILIIWLYLFVILFVFIQFPVSVLLLAGVQIYGVTCIIILDLVYIAKILHTIDVDDRLVVLVDAGEQGQILLVLLILVVIVGSAVQGMVNLVFIVLVRSAEIIIMIVVMRICRKVRILGVRVYVRVLADGVREFMVQALLIMIMVIHLGLYLVVTQLDFLILEELALIDVLLIIYLVTVLAAVRLQGLIHAHFYAYVFITTAPAMWVDVGVTASITVQIASDAAQIRVTIILNMIGMSIVHVDKTVIMTGVIGVGLAGLVFGVAEDGISIHLFLYSSMHSFILFTIIILAVFPILFIFIYFSLIYFQTE